MIVLDTHAWVWFLAEPARLSRRARREVEAAVGRGQVFVSSISVWEVALLARRGRLILKMAVEEWIAHAEGLPFLSFVPVDNRIAMRSVGLAAALGPDPADRMIVATAAILGASLVTKDEGLRAVPGVQTIW